MRDRDNSELRKQININEDACSFYESAKEKAKDPQIKATFSNLEDMHKDVVVHLQQQVRVNGGDAEADETFVGQMTQFWGELMANISNDVDATLIKHLEDAEDRCLHALKDALDDDDLSPDTRQVLLNELSTLQRSHDYMKTLKDRIEAA